MQILHNIGLPPNCSPLVLFAIDMLNVLAPGPAQQTIGAVSQLLRHPPHNEEILAAPIIRHLGITSTAPGIKRRFPRELCVSRRRASRRTRWWRRRARGSLNCCRLLHLHGPSTSVSHRRRRRDLERTLSGHELRFRRWRRDNRNASKRRRRGNTSWENRAS